MPTDNKQPTVAVIGGGPAGLMAAEVMSQAGLTVDLYDAMPSVGRKFLMAGKSGLNLTHAEPLEDFLSRYSHGRECLSPMLKTFGPEHVRQWAAGLGIETFVGSSGRVFPKEMKAAPLLRAWVHRLREAGVRFHMRHAWQGWDDSGALRFLTLTGEKVIRVDAVVLALGGGSWSRLGSTGSWVSLLQQHGIQIAPLQPSNCGFELNWSAHMVSRFAGEPVKPVILSFTDLAGVVHSRQGEFVISRDGIEGSLIYTFSAFIRDTLLANGSAMITLDLLPAFSHVEIVKKLSQSRGSRSLSEHLRRQLGITGVKAALLREVTPAETFSDFDSLATAIKALPLKLERTRPIDEAISTAGGICFSELDENLMLKSLPGTFCAGEMLDWDAPTGGYLLTASFASGYLVGCGVSKFIYRDVKQ